MSIVKMRRTVRKQIKVRLFGRTIVLGSAMSIVFWIIVIIFVVGTYYMYGPGGGGGAGGRQGATRKVSAIVAVVDGRKISRGVYEGRLYYAMRTQGAGDIIRQRWVKKGVLDDLINAQLKLAAARAEDISVSRAEIQQKRDQIVEEIIQYEYSDKTQLRKMLREKNISLEDFKRELRSSRQVGDEDSLRTMLLFEKLENAVKEREHVTDKDVKDSFIEVKTRHILIDPEQLAAEMKEKAKKDEEAPAEPAKKEQGEEAGAQEQKGDEGKDAAEAGKEPVKEPSEAELEAAARKKLTELRKQIVEEGADFAEVAREHSHCPSAAKGGELDPFNRDAFLAEEFKEAAFKLKPGEVSDIVKTDFGFHLIKVEERELKLPEDFEENKAQYKAQVTQRRKDLAWRRYQEELRDKAEIEIIDPELRAYDLLGENAELYAAKAAQLLTEAAKADPEDYGARYELAMLYDGAGEKERALKGLQELAKSMEEHSSPSPDVHLKMGELLKDLKRTDEAVKELKVASEAADGFEFENQYLHMNLKALFEEMGEQDLAKEEQEWLDEFSEQRGGTAPGTIEIE
jgi:parvulin-like peptidyl-prolyl isomerase